MKLERLHEYLTGTVVILVGMAVAVLAGQSTGEGQMKLALAIIAVMCVSAVCLSLRTSTWLLIPLCWDLSGTVPITNLPFSIRDMAIAIAIATYLVFYALKALRYKPPFDSLDGLIYLNLLYLGTVFLRNPVGVNWLETDLVGGKPYFNIIMAFLAYWVIIRAPARLKTIRRMPFLMLIGSALVSIVALVVYVVPSTANLFGQFYSVFTPVEEQSGVEPVEDMIGRKPNLASVGVNGMRVWSSYFRPIEFFSPTHPFKMLGMIVFLLAILFSGFRNFFFGSLVLIGLSCYFRKKITDLILLSFGGALFLLILAIGNNHLFTLPLSVQRSLSFLPGDWDYAAKADAQNSTEWRYQIWQMVISEDRWIKNKWLGDGFGFTRYELSIMTSREGYIGGAGAQEAFLVGGFYHNGPLSAIRYAGVVGLALIMWLMFVILRRSYRVIIACRGTPLFPMALFIGLPMIYYPLPFVFVFGAYDNAMIDLLFSAACIRLLERGLEILKKESAESNTDKPPIEIASYPGYGEGRLIGGQLRGLNLP